MAKQIIILLGLPGSGKGTQGAVLSKNLSVPHISTGDILRKMALKDSDESRILASRLSAGELVSDSIVNKIVSQFIQSDECTRGCILDGYPRTLEQAKYLIDNINADISVVFFNLEDDVVIKRVLGRITCVNCRRLYNKYFDKPKEEGVCDDCGSNEFSERSDDDENTIIQRIGAYKKETLPLIEYFKKKTRFFTVNAGQTKKKVTDEVSSIVKKV